MGTRILLGLLAVLLAAGFQFSIAGSQAEKSVFVLGKSECLDCADKNVKTELAYEGLQVAIKCKTSSGDYEIKGTGKLDKKGNYKVLLPTELIGDDGGLKHECIAQLHSASNEPCPGKHGMNPSTLVSKSQEDRVRAFSTDTKLPFSSATCASAFLLPWHKKFPPFKFPPKKPCPPVKKPVPWPVKPLPIYKKPMPTFPPIYHKPMPKFPPIYKKPYHPLAKFPPPHAK